MNSALVPSPSGGRAVCVTLPWEVEDRRGGVGRGSGRGGAASKTPSPRSGSTLPKVSIAKRC